MAGFLLLLSVLSYVALATATNKTTTAAPHNATTTAEPIIASANVLTPLVAAASTAYGQPANFAMAHGKYSYGAKQQQARQMQQYDGQPMGQQYAQPQVQQYAQPQVQYVVACYRSLRKPIRIDLGFIYISGPKPTLTMARPANRPIRRLSRSNNNSLILHLSNSNNRPTHNHSSRRTWRRSNRNHSRIRHLNSNRLPIRI